MGPITLFDKSFLQALSLDESVWFDAFFMSNMAPPFFVETLADLEKEDIRATRTPEDEVRIIADKSPELSGGVNTFHRDIFIQSLLGAEIPMVGRILMASGKPVQVDGKKSVVFSESKEAEAFQRWQKGEFREIERRIARVWRGTLLERPKFEQVTPIIREMGLKIDDCRSITDVKALVDRAVDGEIPLHVLAALSLVFQPAPEAYENQIAKRFQANRAMSLRSFAPYAAFVFSIDLFFYISMARGFIAADRASNRTDFAYLYYLPFCVLFVSADRLHRQCATLFLRSNQKFVWGLDLKEGLRKINQYFSALPESEKRKGVFELAKDPPDGMVADLWQELLRKNRPIIEERTQQANVRPEVSESEKDMIERFSRFAAAAKVAPGADFSGEPDSVLIERRVRRKRGSWLQIPEHVKD